MPISLPRVLPGDLITAADWNAMVDAITSAFVHIDALEAGAQPTTGLAITQLIPSGPYRVGDTIQVVGRNFQLTIGATRVFLNATPVLNLLPSSSDSRLEFVIPPLTGIPAVGTMVDMVVLNQTESVTRQIEVRPRQSSLQGNVTVDWLGVDPATVTPTTEAFFRYRIRSGTNNRATWLVNPQIDVAANSTEWNAQLRVLRADRTQITNRQLDLAPGQELEFLIHVVRVPDNTANVLFGLTVSVSAEAITGTSGMRQFTVGTPVQDPDNTIEVSPQPVFSGGALSGSTLTVPANSSVDLVLAASFTVAGSYTITRSLTPAAPPGWTFSLISGTRDDYVITAGEVAGGAAVQRLLQYSMAATGTAVTPVQVNFQIQRVGEPKSKALSLTAVRSG